MKDAGLGLKYSGLVPMGCNTSKMRMGRGRLVVFLTAQELW